MPDRSSLAIIGSGPTCVFLLQRLHADLASVRSVVREIVIFEQRQPAGMGMPYHPATTDRLNLSNISSEELPALPVTFADWLRSLDGSALSELDIEPGAIDDGAIYPRLALGRYLHAQFESLVAGLNEAGIATRTFTDCCIADVQEKADEVILTTRNGTHFAADRVVIATGHCWPENDRPAEGYFASPWPIGKLLPAEGVYFNHSIGTLGASLSAFDVVSSLAHRHGTFDEEGFHPHPSAGEFRIAMHAVDGLLPHLVYAQEEPLRNRERHVSDAELLALRDEAGFLRLATYFDQVCRRVLVEAFRKDGRADMVALLENRDFGFAEFAAKMTAEHTYADAFEGLRAELRNAGERPIHWKEAVDDLMYTLNFHADLMPAEDHQLLHAKILPFVMNVIAALPLQSARLLLALRDAGRLEIVAGKARVLEPAPHPRMTTVEVENDGEKTTHGYRLFVECGGQGPLPLDEFPFPSLRAEGHLRAARTGFAHAPGTEEIGGIDVDDGYRVISSGGRPSGRVFDVAFPHIAGVRPYSYGLQACDETARQLTAALISG